MAPRRTLVREVNPHLICVLCRGYFIEATTITECLHSFCRSCLVKYLETSKFCPICDVQLHKNNPLLSVRCDSTLQQLVYKLIPGLYANEMARRRKYYSELGGPTSDPECSEYPIGDAYFAPDDSISLSLEFTSASVNKDEDGGGGDGDDSVRDKQGVLHRRYLQCPAAVTMSHLQKFLRMKYGFSHDVKVDIIYDGEVLTEEFSLMDVAYTFNWKRAAPMRFKFRLLQKSDIVSTSRGAERAKKLTETKDNDASAVQQKPVAEAKVFAFATVKTNPVAGRSSFPLTAPSKILRESKPLVDPKETTPVDDPPRFNETSTVKAHKDVKAPLSTCLVPERDLASATPVKNQTPKTEDQLNSTASLKRKATLDTKEDPPVETKKVKLLLEPTILKYEKRKSGAKKAQSKVAVAVKEAPVSKVESKNESQKSEKSSRKDSPKREVTKRAKEVAAAEANYTFEDDEEEPNYMDDIIQEEEYEDYEEEGRLRICPSEQATAIDDKVDSPEDERVEEMNVEPEPVPEPEEPIPEPEPVKYSRSEEKRKEKKKNKKAKHHHHRHHERKRDSPPIATILHSPDNDLKLKFKLTNPNPKPQYTILDNSESKKEAYNNHSSKNNDKYFDKEARNKSKDAYEYKIEDPPKKSVSPLINNNYNNLNNNSVPPKNNQIEPFKVVETGSKERAVQMKVTKPKIAQPSSPKVASPKVPSPTPAPKPTSSISSKPNNVPKACSSPRQIPIIKQNGSAAPIKSETIKLPPSSITVSKITAAEKAQMEQQKFLMQRNNNFGLDSKRPSLEIMLVNAPKKAGDVNDSKPIEVKKVMRPTPPSIPLSRLKHFAPKGSPPPLVLANKSLASNDENGALDLSGKSSRKSPEIDSMRNLVMLSNTAAQERSLVSSLEPLKIPVPPIGGMSLKTGYQQQAAPRAMKPGPNQSVRQIPNPSALMFRQHALNNQRCVPPSLPINSLRKMESMAKNINIEKVAAGLSVKAAVEAGYQPKL